MASRAAVVVFTGLVALGAASLAAAQPPPPPPPPPPRDVGPPAAIDPVPGGAVISGVVVTTDATPRPVRRAVVRITGAGGERMVVTDDEGRFSIDDLPAGRFGIVASRPGYVTMAYGARRPGGQGTQITLIRGGTATLTIPLPGGAVLEGRLTRPDGTPASRVPVAAIDVDGGTRIVEQDETDDRGMFRIHSLPAGTYRLRASSPTIPTLMVGVHRRSAQEVDALLAGLGARPGPGQSRQPSPVADNPRRALFAPVYYPGVDAADQALLITVAAGEERTALNFTFAPVTLARVSGAIVGVPGDVRRVQVRLATLASLPTPPGAPELASDGTFTFPAVAPGEYTLLARFDPDNAPPVTDGRIVTPGRDPATLPAGDNVLWSRMTVRVGGTDVTGIQVALQPGGRVTGRARFDGNASGQTTAGVRLRATPAEAFDRMPPMMTGFTTAREVAVDDEGTFTVAGLAPGRYLLTATPTEALTTEGWRAGSITHDGRDLLDAPFEIAPGTHIDDADLVLSRARASLVARLELPDGRPGDAYFVIAFSTNPEHWHVNSRRTHATRPADDGRFVVDDLPPGDYFVTVLSDFMPADLSAPDFFEEAARAGVRVTLSAGETVEQTFRVAGDVPGG